MAIPIQVFITIAVTVASLALAAPVALAAPATQPASRAPTLTTPIGELPIFPPDNPWNTDISRHPVHPSSAAFVRAIGEGKSLHPDFGTVWNGAPSGIPFNLVRGRQKKVTIEKWEYGDESDQEPYPIPDQPLIEGGPNAPADSDRHVLMIDIDNRRLYELYQVIKTPTGWRAGSGAIWDLASNKLRPERWTSADAAGLPIFPGLARYDEVIEKKEIRHALRFTAQRTQRGYILPATHWASRSTDLNLPPMGLRVRLKASYDITGFPPAAQVILRGLKTYGMILADNGGDWFISGAPDPRWNDDELNTLKRVKGSDLEAVDTGPIVTERR